MASQYVLAHAKSMVHVPAAQGASVGKFTAELRVLAQGSQALLPHSLLDRQSSDVRSLERRSGWVKVRAGSAFNVIFQVGVLAKLGISGRNEGVCVVLTFGRVGGWAFAQCVLSARAVWKPRWQVGHCQAWASGPHCTSPDEATKVRALSH